MGDISKLSALDAKSLEDPFLAYYSDASVAMSQLEQTIQSICQ